MNKKRGFTIIELLVVVAIIAILPLVAVSDFGKIKSRFSVSRAAYRLVQDLRRVQNMALSSVQYKDAFGQVQKVGGYGVYIDINSLGSTTYLVYADAEPANRQYDALDYVVEIVNFGPSEPNTVIGSLGHIIGQRASIHFSPPNLAATITGLQPETSDIEIIFNDQNDEEVIKTVIVNTSGLIEVQ